MKKFSDESQTRKFALRVAGLSTHDQAWILKQLHEPYSVLIGNELSCITSMSDEQLQQAIKDITSIPDLSKLGLFTKQEFSPQLWDFVNSHIVAPCETLDLKQTLEVFLNAKK